MILAEVGFTEAWWIQIVKCLVIVVVVLQIAPVMVLLERKWLGRLQSRYGPNRVGPWGIAQPLADVVKLLTKENSTPVTAVPWMMTLAPMISVLTAVMTLAVIPWGDRGTWGDNLGLYGIDVPIGILYMFAFGSIAFYGFLLGGWASGSKFSFLGSMRAAAQLISYEVSLGLALLGIVIMSQSLSLVTIVHEQDEVWYIVPQFFGFCIFLIAGFAETARPPFDLPEADAELVAGYNTEYGGMRFGAFYMAEYMHIIVYSGLATAIFLGGWHGPGPVGLGPLWVTLKMFLVVCFFIWARATFPRLRYDQLMSFGWKVLLPLATVNALVTAILVVVT